MLLKKANTITTPTAYSNGFLHSVKPEVVENLLLYSNDFSQTDWVQVATARTGGQLGYDGSNDAWELVRSSGGSLILNQSQSLSGVYTFSCYIKINATNGIGIGFSSSNYALFNISDALQTSAVFETGAVSSTINYVGNNFYRISITANGSFSEVRFLNATSDGTSASSGGGTHIVQDAQLNKGAVAYPYLETTTEAKPSADFTFTRNSSATRVNELGYIEEVTDDIPRINYEGFTYENGLPVPYSGKGHLLLEPQRTNLFTYSESFSDYYTNRCDKTDLGAIAIRSSGSIARFTANSAAAYFGKTISSLSSGSTYTISAFFDITEGIYAGIRDASSNTAIFNILTGELIGTIGTLVASCTSTKIDSSNYHRVAFTFTATITGTHYFVIGTSSGTINTTNETISAGYFQREDGATYATSYIPTNGTAVTRLGETCNNATQSFPSEGVLYGEIAALANDGTFREITINDGTSSNTVEIRYSSTSNEIQYVVRSGGAVQVVEVFALDNALEFNKFAARYKENDFSLFVNGVQVATDTSGIEPVGLSQLHFWFAGGSNFYGKTKMVATFPYLSNDEMECLTGEGYGTFEALAAAYSYTIK